MNQYDEKALKKLIKLCKKNGINHIQVGSVVLSFGESPERSARSGDGRALGEVNLPKVTGERMPSDSDLLFWSAGTDEETELKEPQAN